METTDGEMLDGEVGQGYIGWETLDQGAGWRRCLRRCQMETSFEDTGWGHQTAVCSMGMLDRNAGW